MSQGVANFLFEALNFLLLAGLLGYVLWKPVRRALNEETQRYEAQQERSERTRREAEGLLAAAKQAQTAAAHDAQRERDQLLAAAQLQAKQIVEQARRTEDEMRAAFLREQEHTRAAQAVALADQLAMLAADSLRSLLARLDGPELDLALIRGACEKLRALPEDARGHAQVESARPLSDSARSWLEQVLGGPVHARTVAELGAGVRVTTALGQVDATAVALARQAAHAVHAAAPSASEPAGDQSASVGVLSQAKASAGADGISPVGSSAESESGHG